MRKNITDAEGLLWYYLREFKESGFYFRRQVPIGNYIIDFACLKHKLVIEVDGLHHGDPIQIAHDTKRDEWLRQNEYTVLHFDNDDVFKRCDMTLQHIQNALDLSLPLRGGGSRSVCKNAKVGGGARADV